MDAHMCTEANARMTQNLLEFKSSDITLFEILFIQRFECINSYYHLALYKNIINLLCLTIVSYNSQGDITILFQIKGIEEKFYSEKHFCNHL